MSAYHEHPVFVYGTLKRGCPNHHLIENVQEGRAEFLANGVSSDPWPLVVYTQFNVPFVLDRRGTGKVWADMVWYMDWYDMVWLGMIMVWTDRIWYGLV